VLKGKYLGQKPPGMVPEVFAAGIASTCDYEHGCITFSPNGDEAYWSTSFMLQDTGYSTGSIMGTRVEDGKWTKPRFIPFSETSKYDGDVPFFAPDGETLYFISRRPLEGDGEHSPERIWYAGRKGDKWSIPRPVEGEHGAIDIHWQFAVTDDGTIYFGGRGPDSRGMGDIYMMKLADDKYGEPENLGEPVCTEAGEGSPYVTPDGSLMLFSVIGREDNLGGADIYICRRNKNGTWTEPVNPGEPINSRTNEQCPMISPDGKYLFFLSHRGQTSDIWWVDAKVLEDL
jgi:Tol biopolymer transport system component